MAVLREHVLKGLSHLPLPLTECLATYFVGETDITDAGKGVLPRAT